MPRHGRPSSGACSREWRHALTLGAGNEEERWDDCVDDLRKAEGEEH